MSAARYLLVTAAQNKNLTLVLCLVDQQRNLSERDQGQPRGFKVTRLAIHKSEVVRRGPDMIEFHKLVVKQSSQTCFDHAHEQSVRWS